ncbi:hypothetical protein [Silvibacterium acidisoli]|uniref:hypothetical protein n=1 Tax=Acidobacteriaceae bacterium ZG23-2 TaxID=2883246 RepID=UPI00406C6066
MSTNSNSLWGGPCLYTPIHVDAMMIGTPNQTQTFANVQMNYANLLRGLNPAPLPFTLAPIPPATGIYVHWTLPYALRRGHQDPQGNVTFPYSPNRWLVTRFQILTPGSAPVATAWVVQSDYFAPTPAEGGTNLFPSPLTAGQIGYLGRQIPLAQWVTPADTPLFLEAQGPGEMSWAAVFQNVGNVFGFFDPVGQSGTCAYSVLGWYSQPAADPLYGYDGKGFTTPEEWQTIMDAQGWALASPDDRETLTEQAVQAFAEWIEANPQQNPPPATDAQLQYASQTLCQGMVFDLPWTGPATAYPQPTILTGGAVPAVAVGSTAAEAVAAFMGDQLQSTGQDPLAVENLLLAFQTDSLTTYLKEPSQFLFTCQENRFDRAAAGTLWTVVLPKANQSETDGSQEIPLSPEQTQALSTLQTTQNLLDTAVQQFGSDRWELYSAWWKLQAAKGAGSPYQPQIQQYITQLTGTTMPALAQQITNLTAQRDSQQTALEGLLGKDYELKASNATQYTNPTDPVVLISSANTDTKLDGPQDLGADLFTRFTGQAVGGLIVDFTNIIPNVSPVTLEAAELSAPVTALPTAGLPKEATDAWIESILLDPGNSTWLAQMACTKANIQATPEQLTQLAARIATQQTLVWNPLAKDLDQRTVAEAAGLLPQFPDLDVHVPSKQAVAAWIPPWTPLYLDWEIQWMPSATTPGGMYGPWQLAESDFVYTGSSVAPVAATMQMRSLLTSNYPDGLTAKIADFLDTDPDIPAFEIRDLKLTVEAMAKLDVMVQSLTGLDAWMESRTPMPTQPITDPTVAKWTEGVLTWVANTPGGVAPIFNPLRAGHFRITRLQVVDAFGQVMPGNAGQGNILPIRSQSLMPPSWNTDQSLMQLVPRVAQGARLIQQLIDRDDDTIASNSSDLTNPICGWLLPNHLDESLMVFDSAGVSLGEIIKVVTDSGKSLRWDAAPGSDAALGSPPQIANRHLQALVSSLLSLGLTTTEPLDELLDLIDVTLWSSSALPSAGGARLSVMLGQPIAVVRTAFYCNLQGNPIYQQDWSQTGKNNDLNFPTVQLPFQIGDMALATNGSFGYYVGDDYSGCYAMYGYQPDMGYVRRALRNTASGRSNLTAHIDSFRSRLQNTLSSSGGYVKTDNKLYLQCGGADKIFATVLVDPRGKITTVSGTAPMFPGPLPNGPVASALDNLCATFRMGPLLLDPVVTTMPLPTGTSGKWDWIERTGVSFWREQGPVRPANPTAELPVTIPTLREGWLSLSEALGSGQGE